MVGLALFACRGTERASAPSGPAGAVRKDDGFHELLSKPAREIRAGAVPAQVLKAAVERSNAASFALWQAFAEKENFVVSPYSIRSALGLVYLASVPGDSRSSLQRGFRYPEHNEDMDVSVLDGAIQVTSQARFESKSAVWVARQRALSPTYLDAVSRILPAEVHAIDFAADPERAQQTINAWVSDRTRGRITKLLEDGAITPETRATLVNAVYFFGKWLDPFHAERTVPKPFRTSHGTTIKTEMMVGAACSAVFSADSQAAFAQYLGTSLVFVVVMPKHWREFRWDAAAFSQAWAALDRSQDAELELPRFSLRSRKQLAGVLRKLGLSLSDPQLVSRLLASGEPVIVEPAIHEAFIQVDETSTEAAAATAIAEVPTDVDVPPPVFRVDQPFYFLLVERKTGLIAFMGQVTDPTAAGG
jgi:serpin B